MLGTGQADTLGAEGAGYLCIVGSVGIGAHLHLGVLVAEVHQGFEVAAELSSLGGYLAGKYLAGGTVEGDVVALLIGYAFYLHGLGLIVHVDGACTADAALAHTAGYNGSVAGHTAASGEDAFSAGHTGEVFGAGLDAYHHYLVAVGCPLLGIVGVEYYLTAGCTGAGRQTLGDDFSLFQGVLVEYGVEQLVELLGLAAQYGCLLVDESLAHKVHGNLDHGCAGALAVAGLQEPQLALLYGELHVLHVVVVVLQLVLDGVELSIYLRHSFLHGGILGCALCLADACTLCPALAADLGNLLRGADTGHHVFALSIDEVLTVEEVLAITCVAAEANACSGGVTHIAEHHGHHADGCAPLVGYALHLAIEDGTLVHPAAEYGADGAPELLHRVVGEVLAGLLLDGSLEEGHQLLQVLNAEILVQADTLLLFNFLDDSLKGVDVLLVDRLHAQHHVAVHLYEAAVAVIYEVGVAGLLDHTLGHLVVKAQVEDSVHHARH